MLCRRCTIPGIRDDIDVIQLEHLFSVSTNLLIVDVEYVILALHQCDLDVVMDPWIYFGHILSEKILHFGCKLHTCWSSTHHRKMQQSLSFTLKLGLGWKLSQLNQ